MKIKTQRGDCRASTRGRRRVRQNPSTERTKYMYKSMLCALFALFYQPEGRWCVRGSTHPGPLIKGAPTSKFRKNPRAKRTRSVRSFQLLLFSFYQLTRRRNKVLCDLDQADCVMKDAGKEHDHICRDLAGSLNFSRQRRTALGGYPSKRVSCYCW